MLPSAILLILRDPHLVLIIQHNSPVDTTVEPILTLSNLIQVQERLLEMNLSSVGFLLCSTKLRLLEQILGRLTPSETGHVIQAFR